MTTTSAKDIMRADSVKAPTIQVQTQPTVFFEQKINVDGDDVIVRALNTKGDQGTFDKITLKAYGYDFDVKDITLSNIEMLGADGASDNLIEFHEVRAETIRNGEKREYAFIDPTVTGYVAALVKLEANQSDIKEIKPKTRQYALHFDGNMFAIDNENITEYLSTHVQEDKPNFGRLMSNLTSRVEGSNGSYTVRFYDRDKNPNNIEFITVQKDSDKEFLVTARGLGNVKLRGLDTTLEGIDFKCLHLDNIDLISDNIIFDYKLCEYVFDKIETLLLNDKVYRKNIKPIVYTLKM